jgi:phage gpG-like protein
MEINFESDDLYKLQQLQNKLNDNELLEIIARPIENTTRDSFASETDPWGKPWVNQDSPTYHHLDSTSHNMQGSLHSKVNRDKSVEVGFNAISKDGFPYPAVHQFGSKDGRIPQRAFMPVDSDGKLETGLKKDILEDIEEWLS